MDVSSWVELSPQAAEPWKTGSVAREGTVGRAFLDEDKVFGEALNGRRGMRDEPRA